MAKIQFKKDCILVKTESRHDVLKCLSIHGYAKLFDDVFEYKHISIMAVLRNFYDINSLVELKQRVDAGAIPEVLYKLALKYDELFDMTEQLKQSGPMDSGDTFLFKHQQLCRQIALLNKRYGFFLETGTGKTPLALQIIADDIVLNPAHRWLVICPLALINTAWIEDCNKFFPHLKIVSLHGNTTKQTKTAFATPGHIYVINFESFKIYYDALIMSKFEGAFVDESSKMKNNSSGTTKAILKFANTVNRFYELSGTPAPNSLLEYYPQMSAIDKTLLPSNFTSFKSKYFFSYSKGGFDAFDITEEKKAELIEIIKQKAIFISKKDCLDLPGKLPPQIRELTMNADTRKIYNQMKNDLYATLHKEFETVTVLAANSVTSLQKLNQLTSGFLLDDGEVHKVSNQKINELMDVLEELGDRQVIIWANYHGEFDAIKEKLGDDCVLYYGDTKKADIERLCIKHFGERRLYELLQMGKSHKDIAVKLFKEGYVKYFVANPKSAGYGLTLTNCSYQIFYGLSYSYESYAQALDRTDRYGQTEPCTYIYLLMKNTIDYVLYQCMQTKGTLLSSVLDHLKPLSIGGE
jgi:SNF2 family DNA or RNA helicase